MTHSGKNDGMCTRRSAIFKKGPWKRVPNNNQIVFMYYI